MTRDRAEVKRHESAKSQEVRTDPANHSAEQQRSVGEGMRG